MKIKPEVNFQHARAGSTEADVDQHDQQSLQKWALILGLSNAELLEAIKKYGGLVKNIRRGLREKKKNKAA